MSADILRVAVPSPLHRYFDYLAPPEVDGALLKPGVRLSVPFGRSQKIGVLVELCEDSPLARSELRYALQVLDDAPVLGEDLLVLLKWAQRYYHHPPGDVFSTALPLLLRQGKAAEAGATRRSKKQPDDSPATAAATAKTITVPSLNPAQAEAVETVCASLQQFQAFLLDGVTGSGKTEVYLRIVEAVLARQQQALVLVPEIGLTPQLLARFQDRLQRPLAILHSALTNRERLNAWLRAKSGDADVIIGTRSAIFTAMANPGVIILDEEHDSSFKQQDGFRYSARDLAVVRAQQRNIPVVLGSATPSLETLHNVKRRRYQRLRLPDRVGGASEPQIELLDMRRQPLEAGLSVPLLKQMESHLAQGNQVLLFLNRRGFAPTLICHECGWLSQCHQCDARMTLHMQSQQLICHHCLSQRPVEISCPSCGSIDLRALGQGTERIETVLNQRFPDIGIARLDRDNTRRKGSLQQLLDDIRSGYRRILIGTQMLAKGHHFPDVTLVGIVDIDQGLFGADYRASERMAQQVLQVAGRAGRADKSGSVIIQTHFPGHVLLHTLINKGYPAFAAMTLAERQQAGLPPFACQVLLRADATQAAPAQAFLQEAANLARHYQADIELLGPAPAPMERRAGRYRAQLLIQAAQRSALHALLQVWVEPLSQLKSARKVRWSIDVDPLDLL